MTISRIKLRDLKAPYLGVLKSIGSRVVQVANPVRLIESRTPPHYTFCKDENELLTFAIDELDFIHEEKNHIILLGYAKEFLVKPADEGPSPA